MTTSSASRSGTVLMTVAVVVLLLGALASATVNLMVSGVEGQTARQEGVVLVIAAEDAVNQAVRDLEADLAAVDALAVGDTLTVFGDREVNGCVTAAECRKLDDDEVLITATAASGTSDAERYGAYEAQVRTAIEYGPGSAFDYGLFSDQPLDSSSNLQTDSYDSSLGRYGEDEDNVGSEGHIGSNGDIRLWSASTHVRGNATPGHGDPPHTLTKHNNADVDGSTAPASQTVLLPEPVYTVPSEDDSDNEQLSDHIVSGPDGDELTVSSNLTVPEGADLFVFSSMTVNSAKTFTLSKDTEIYITSSLLLKSNATIDLAGHALTIYLEGDFTMSSNSRIENTGRPEDFHLVVRGDESTVTKNSNTDLTGVVYAPTARVELNSNFDLFGSVVGGEVGLDSNLDLHYDVSLADLTADWIQVPVGLAVTRWRGTTTTVAP